MSFTIDADGLRESGDRLAALGEQFESAIEQLRAKIAGYGEPWGADTIGMLVGLSFPVVGDHLLECCAATADEYQLSGEDLAGMADDYEADEEELASAFRQFADRMG